MGRTPENKREIVADLKQLLSEAKLAVVIDYHGLTVTEISELRQKLRPTGATCKIAKNTLMRIAIADDPNWQPMTEFLKGSSACVLVKDDLSAAIKAYQAFKKSSKKTELRGGVMDGKLLSEADVKAIGDLPSREELLAQVAGAINALATKIAVGIKEVPASLGRGIKAYAEKEGSTAENDAA